MAGFLGTRAPFVADLSLVLTWLFGMVAIVGAIKGHRRRISKHCPVMATGALLNWIPVLMIMIPRWLGMVVAGADPPGGAPRLPAIGHGLLGGMTQVLMTYTVTRMYWLEDLPPRRPIWLMRATIVLWMLSLLGGTFVYLLLYVF